MAEPYLDPAVAAPASEAPPERAPKKDPEFLRAAAKLAPNPFANDDGSRPAAFAEAKAVEPPHRTPAVVRAMVGGRVLVPVLAHAHPGRTEDGGVVGHAAAGSGDDAADACESAALAQVEVPDGRHAMPVFTSAEAMKDWDPSARPVPVYGPQAAQAAASAGDGLILLDPGDEAVLIGRPAVWSLAAGTEWVPAWQDEELGVEAAKALTGIAGTLGVALVPGRSAEVAAVVLVEDGLERAAAEEMLGQVAIALGASEMLRERVDSLEIVPTRTRG